ncbi:MAG: O-linked N-acetylglucosamine transferase, SPINDLY family protein [Myxacorys californica WJT36-NPBG1]|jgi:predicted O-linked N-acetylglucosamine transferase (SPINDLY family)|nr:O-linked N-acetylglucosamine transferase, SPINDLY family protein [Myxacorys californica WJT36-NPBG1]
MNVITPLTHSIDWQQQAYNYLVQGAYTQAATFYEQALEVDPTVKSHYWHLGLFLLLQGLEAEAQTTWFMGIADGEPDQIEPWTAELIAILQTEAERRETLQDYLVAWCIRQHIREICPDRVENVLHLILLSQTLETLTTENCVEWNAIPLLRAQRDRSVDSTLLLQALSSVLNTLCPDPLVLEFTEACLPQIQDPQELKNIVAGIAFNVAHSMHCVDLAIQLLELCLRLDSTNTELLSYLAPLAQNAGHFNKGIDAAQQCYDLTNNLPEKLFAHHLLIRGLMSASGRWQQAIEAWQTHQHLLASLTLNDLKAMDIGYTLRLFNSAYYLPYFSDQPDQSRKLQNQLTSLCQESIQLSQKAQVERYQQRHSLRVHSSSRRLKIGYLSHCMCRHSVGWLARWLMQHHDRDQFQLHGYFVIPKQNDELHNWYISSMDKARQIDLDSKVDSFSIADTIHDDEIDILIDLDSITLDISCAVMALKPAPVQVSWLGWDGSGVPAIDYYIADPYVLPESAQSYYSEKIWRLPQTYIAVDGFEVDVPTLRRTDLEIPTDAVVFLSAQRGHKRHPETARLQMQIIKAVPNSYFLIKGASDQSSLKSFFVELAEEIGVSIDRLRFLSEASIEAAHRANLAIADVVLDTFPYNGATTTLETLWMGIPLVTRVGEQFAARNSYTMMVNAGISEGIAWSNEEYVEWGVRLGKEAALRQKIHWDLMRSRQTAPLWNAKQFTRDMETAYQQMWEIYQRS